MTNAVGNQTPIIKPIPRADPTPTWSAVPPGERRMILIPSFDASRIARGPSAPGSHHSFGSSPEESAVGLIQKRKVLPFATLDRIEFTQNPQRPTRSDKGILTPLRQRRFAAEDAPLFGFRCESPRSPTMLGREARHLSPWNLIPFRAPPSPYVPRKSSDDSRYPADE